MWKASFLSRFFGRARNLVVGSTVGCLLWATPYPEAPAADRTPPAALLCESALVGKTPPSQLRGGRGHQHCALSVGIVLGGLLGLTVNPLLATQVIRLGLIASGLHCS
jgi:hypothetical protein